MELMLFVLALILLARTALRRGADSSALTQEKCNNDLLTKGACSVSALVHFSLVPLIKCVRTPHPRSTDLRSFLKETCASALAIPTRAVLVVVTWYQDRL